MPAQWYLRIALEHHDDWDLKRGQSLQDWDPDTVALSDNIVASTDFPVTSGDIPVYSPRLIGVVAHQGVAGIQLLPLRVRHRPSHREYVGYHIANYLEVIDCLDRRRSTFQVWTKDNLLFWEQRPWLLGTFRDVQRAVLDVTKIGKVPVFRLWGWEGMVIVRVDLKQAIEAAGITGCRFTELESVP